MEIFIDNEPFHVTMRLPGDEIALAIGFCFTEQVIDSMDDLITVSHCKDISTNRINVYRKHSRNGAALARSGQRRAPSLTSCGICGKQMISDLSISLRKVRKDITVEASRIAALQGIVFDGQEVFRGTGGTHAAGIFTKNGDLLALAEDVGRHNALDKAIGKVLFAHREQEAAMIALTSRLSYEMVQKAARLGVEVLAGASCATSLAIELAGSVEMTLIGFARGNQGNVYTCPERVIRED
ncbi:MAG: formate dehydrogenase accessory protein [Syntrophorhabdus sp. PtaU1.Bin050]|nr:MAG: formate dehydrogenase accessory protein [Syntrophorhabdus sp. PtaU1.Bin050]